MASRNRAAIVWWCLVVSALAALAAMAERPIAAAAPPPVSGEYRVATWNIRSGDGRCPIGIACPFNDETQNCTDGTQPRNAWAYGVPQAELAGLNQDASVIALGLQEAWGCGEPGPVKAALGWPYASPEYNGTALLARFGISGTLQVKMLSLPGQEQAYVLGADVCADAVCSATLRVYVTHLVYNTSDDHVGDDQMLAQAQGLLAWIATLPHADKHVLIGDFNAFEREVEVSFKCELTFDYRAPQTIRSAGYSDGWQALHGTQPGMTATLNRNGCGNPNGAAWKRIDYAFLKGLTPVSSALFGVVPVNTPAPSDHYGLLTGFTGATDSVGATSNPPPPALITLPAGEILLRAADDARPRIVGRWSIVADTLANGGRKWSNSDLGEPKIATALASPQNYFEVVFTAPAATPYHLWLRMRAQGNDYANDSVSVQFSDAAVGGAAAFRIGTTESMAVVLEDGSGAGVSGWGWSDNAYGGFGAPFTFQQSGTHTIRIQQREDGASIDEILLSPAAYFRSAPGLTKQDTTMFKPTQVPQ
jgi:endonuclease/exonuclease/phosphatase family metal-dependent hydrolase